MEKSNLKKKKFTKNLVAQNRLKGNLSKVKTVSALTLLILGIAIIPGGFLLSSYVQYRLDEGIKEAVQVPHPHNPEYDEWVSNDYDDAVHQYKKFYMWNLTNSDDYLAGNTPQYEEIGPFVYRQYDTKYDISFSDNKDEVSYKEYNTYQFEPDKSIGNSSEIYITNINPAYLGVLNLAGTEANLVKAMFTSVLSELKAGVIAVAEEELAAMESLDFDWNFLGFTFVGLDLPEAEEVFFGEWAHDRFPEIVFTLLEFINIPMDITNLYDVVGDIDVEYENFGVEGTSPSDLKIIDRDDGDSGLTFAQCQNLWDPNNPLSLTGMDVQVDPIWFEALADIEESKDILRTNFSLSDFQLNLILDWIDITINDWLKNVCELQIKEWNSGLITTRTVEEWLFTAVDNLINEMDPVMAKVGIFDNCHNITEAEEAETVKVTVKTGRDDVSKVGQYVEYDGHEDILVWAEPIELSGTGGTQFAPGVSKDDDLEVFVDDLMRVGEFEYSKEVELHGINLYRFKIKEELFEPEPICYMDTEGLANLEPVESIPVRLSKPHFLDADSSLLSNVIGLSPQSSEHDTYLDVEPIIGAVMRARKRLQVNFYVIPTDHWYKDVSPTVLPILWVQESGEIPKDLAEEFLDTVYGATRLRDTIPLLGLGIGAVLCVPEYVVSTKESMKRKKLKTTKDLAKNKALSKKEMLTKSLDSPEMEKRIDEIRRKLGKQSKPDNKVSSKNKNINP